MFIKSTIIALTAVAALGTTMLTSTSADAAGFHRGGGHGFRGHGGGIARVAHIRHGGHGLHRHGFHRHRHWHGHRHWRHRYYLPTPVVYAPRPVIYGAAPVVTTNRCTCLTKEYTPEGAVLFKDICTNEAAINPPPAPVQTGMVAPQQQ